jgi:hypothetical protein
MEKTTINLKSIPLLWTTCDKSKNRHGPMNSMLSNLGLSGEMINGPITNPYPIGVAIGYLQALSKYQAPFLILEDDSTLIKEITLENLQIPEDSDAVYLGTSLYGRIKNKTVFQGVIAAKKDETYIRIFNMLSLHAIVYTSQKYVEHTKLVLNSFIKNPIGGCDDPIADLMWKHNVYALKNPIFYQKDGRSDEATKSSIDCLL